MNILKNSIDYESLEEELEEALREDNLYELRNSAKLRAVEQRVPTYEHFRQIVNGAHLKPLEQKDKTEKVKVSWNRESKSLGLGSGSTCEKNVKLTEKKEFFGEFSDWASKFKFLYDNREKLKQMFRVEMPSEVLGEILGICLGNFEGNAEKIVDILKGISECGRFGISVSFMSESDKLICEKLFQRLVAEETLLIDFSDKFNVNL